MILRNLFLALGLLLSVTSKVLQFKYKAFIGDLIILPAATFFVLAVLFSNPKFLVLLKNPNTQGAFLSFSLYCCGCVLCFQLFTMLAFGKTNPIGYGFLAPLGLFIYLAFNTWQKWLR